MEIAITSTKFSGAIQICFDKQGFWRKINICASLNIEQLKFFTLNFPKTVTGIEEFKGLSEYMSVITEDNAYGFDAFWNAYDYKMDRKNALREWDKLEFFDKILPVESVARYDAHLKTAKVAKIYPERYLKNRRFEIAY